MSDLHSVHADLLAEHPARAVDAVVRLLPRIPTVRTDAADDLVEVIHEFLRDGQAVVTVTVEGLTRGEWEEIDGRHVNGWKKRVEYRNLEGALVAAVDWETDE